MTTEMDHLRAFRAADGAPDEDARAAARVALLDRIDATAAATAAAATPRRLAARPRRQRRGRKRGRDRRGLLAGGLALVATAAAAFALVAGLGSDSVERATAAQVLSKAADVAAGGPSTDLGPGQYWYTNNERTLYPLQPGQRPERFATQLWLARDGHGRIVRHDLPGSVGHELDEALSSENGLTFASSFLPQPLTYDEVRALPTDTDALYVHLQQLAQAWVDQMREAASKGVHPHVEPEATVPQVMLANATSLLTQGPTPPPLRAALYRVVARLPGIELVGSVRDAAGRGGEGVALTTEQGDRFELVFDPDTAVLLETRSHFAATPPGPNYRPAQDAELDVWNLSSGVVDSTDARP
jgi:hypothetical protein